MAMISAWKSSALNGVAMADNEVEHTVIKGNPEGFHSATIPPFLHAAFCPLLCG